MSNEPRVCAFCKIDLPPTCCRSAHEDFCSKNPMREVNRIGIREEIKELVIKLGLNRTEYLRLKKEIRNEEGAQTRGDDEHAILDCLRNKKTYQDYKAKTARLMAKPGGGKTMKSPSSHSSEIVLHVEDIAGKKPSKGEADPFAPEEEGQEEQTIEVRLRLKIRIGVAGIQVLKVE